MPARRTGLIVGLTLAILVTPATAAERRIGQQSPTVVPSPESASASLEHARQLQQEADRHIDARAFSEAIEKTQRALELRRQHLGEMHADVAYSIGRLGVIAYYQGQYDRAEALIGDALRIREATLGRDHLDVAESLNDLASMLLVRGDYVRPAAMFQRALAIYEHALATGQAGGPDRDLPSLAADARNNLALLYHRRGDYPRAESEYLKAVELRERTRGRDDPTVAATMANLGAVYYASGQYEKAAQVLERALGIQEKHLPATHPSLATSNFNLAAVYFDRGEYRNAEVRFRRALAIDEQSLDARHPRLAIRLLGLAEVLRLEGEYASADPFYERALTIREGALGPAHPLVAEALVARSLLRQARGDVDGAVDLLSHAGELREESLTYVLTTGSEEEKRLYLRTLIDETDLAVSLDLGAAPRSSAAARLAFTSLLRRKGRSIDATADQIATLRRRLDDTDRAVLNRLSEAQSRLAGIVLRGVATDDQRQTATTLRSEIQQLEQTISTRSSGFRAASMRATLGGVQETLPGGTALIEFVAYRPFAVKNPRNSAFGAPRYAAYVLRGDRIAASVDLGETALIDGYVGSFRAALSNPGDRRVRQDARKLHQVLMAPIQDSIRDVERLIVSPDGALNLIPFAALVAQDDTYLVEHFTISYVTSGRDLIRFEEFGRESARALTPPTIVANPLFGRLRAASSRTPDALLPRGLNRSAVDQLQQFDALPETAQEAAALARMLPDARLYMGASATESLLKQLRGPSILHVATHGFFLRPPLPRRALTARERSTVPRPGSPAVDREEALVLSGLALAGANQRQSGDGEDGILTALEVAGLDLWGTRMVVLSACDTGLGDARNGEGVYGLRRALVLAGSESQVMSLWQVSDRATRALMIAYYQRLRSGEGRADALRNVQLTFLHGDRAQAHPFYWASFIQSGDWRALPD